MTTRFHRKTLNAAKSRVWFVGLIAGAVVLLATAGVACKNTSASETQQVAVQTAPPPAEKPESFDPAANAPAAPKVDGKAAMKLVTEFVNIGPRPLGSEGHKKAEEFITQHLKDAGTEVDYDRFTADTAAGKFPVTNIIGKIPGSKDGIIVVAGHYETNLPTSDDLKAATAAGQPFVGANDGGSTTGLMLEMANLLEKKKGSAKTLDGYSVWFLFTDAEEATVHWSDQDSVYGSKHLAAEWAKGGTAKKIKAFLLLDMIGDKDLDIQRETNYATPWLEDVIYRAAQRLGDEKYFFAQSGGIEDDHKPFAAVGIPVADIIDLDYGPDNIYHHTSQDTLDKLSPKSLEIVGNVVLETMRAINTK